MSVSLHSLLFAVLVSLGWSSRRQPVTSRIQSPRQLHSPSYTPPTTLPPPTSLPLSLPPSPSGGSDCSPTRTHARREHKAGARPHAIVISIVSLSKFNAAAGSWHGHLPDPLSRQFCSAAPRFLQLPIEWPGRRIASASTGRASPDRRSRRRLGSHDVRARRGRHLARRRRRRGRRRRCGGCPSVSGTPLRLMRFLSSSSC